MILRVICSMAGLNVLKAVASVLVSLLVARNVAPGQFGLVAFSIPLMTFINLVTDLGLTSAIVRQPQLSRRHAGAAISLMSVTGVIGGGLLLSVALALRQSMQLRGITPVLAGFSLVTLLSVWAAGPRALLEREYDYVRLAAVETAALLAASCAFAASLTASFGIMAMLAYYVTFQAVRAAGFLWLSRKLFELNLHLSAILELTRVGGWVLLTNLLNYCARNLDNLLIGSLLGASVLGLYGLAYQFMTLPLVLLSWPISGVLLSTLARLKDRPQTERAEVVAAVITGTAAISFPMMCYMVFGARFPIELIYGHRWQGLATIVALMAPIGAIQSVAAYNGAVLIEKGAVRLNLLLGVLNGGTLSAVFISTVWFGLPVLIVAYVVAATLMGCVITYIMCREADISARRLLSCLMPGTLAAFCGVGAAAAITGLSPDTAQQWILCSLTYCLTVLSVFAVLRHRLVTITHTLGRSAGSLAVLARA